MFEKEAKKWVKENTRIEHSASFGEIAVGPSAEKGFQKGAEFGYNKAKEEMQAQDYSLFDFVMQYENGKFKCKYKSGKEFESVDGETWKEIVDLKAQIEKMKCCGNCAKNGHICVAEEMQGNLLGAISMALKDPTLQQGFEIICKNLAELERKLEQTEKDLADYQFNYPTIKELQKENAELRKVAEFQQSSNMSRHFENKKLKEGLAVGSTFNKALNSMNKNLEEERDKYRNMVFDKDEQLTKAKELLERLLITSCNSDVLNLLPNCSEVLRVRVEAEQFLKGDK